MTPQQMLYKALFIRAKHGVELTVTGISMEPVLHHGDTITVQKKETYEIGDILVFLYKYQELLVHRLLKIENGRYFCKGDNSFRLEDMDASQIIGAVRLDSDPHRGDEFIEASLEISRIFRRSGFQHEATMETEAYKNYKTRYLEKHYEIHKK